MTDGKQPVSNEPGEEIPAEVAGLHPMLIVLASHFKAGENGEQFAPVTEEVLTDAAAYLFDLSELEDADELVHATHSLASFAHANKAESPALVAQVRELLDLPFVVESLKKWSVGSDPEKVKAAAEKFGAFAGTETEKKAPKVGEEKPEGALDLNALKFPKRL